MASLSSPTPFISQLLLIPQNSSWALLFWVVPDTRVCLDASLVKFPEHALWTFGNYNKMQ